MSFTINIRCVHCGGDFKTEKEFQEHDCDDHFDPDYILDVEGLQ